MDVGATVETYVQAWHEPDEGSRRRLLEASWADDAVYADPASTVEGRDALVAHIAGFHARRPGARIEVRSGIDCHGRYLRFAWAVVGADGEVVADGIDFGVLAGDGRIASITGFFGPLPD